MSWCEEEIVLRFRDVICIVTMKRLMHLCCQIIHQVTAELLCKIYCICPLNYCVPFWLPVMENINIHTEKSFMLESGLYISSFYQILRISCQTKGSTVPWNVHIRYNEHRKVGTHSLIPSYCSVIGQLDRRTSEKRRYGERDYKWIYGTNGSFSRTVKYT